MKFYAGATFNFGFSSLLSYIAGRVTLEFATSMQQIFVSMLFISTSVVTFLLMLCVVRLYLLSFSSLTLTDGEKVIFDALKMKGES